MSVYSERDVERFPKTDWQYEVANGDTQLGYSEWVQHRKDAEENGRVELKLGEVNGMIDEADAALDGDSNDAEHDALYSIREKLSEMSQDPLRRKT